jgi:uncharacterized protein (DUF58 family)
VPSRAGLVLGALLFLMLLAGLNYANSLALFLTFLLIAFCLVVMQQCHRNLQDLRVQGLHAQGMFARRAGAVHLTLANAAALARRGISGRIDGQAEAQTELAPGAESVLALPVTAATRGVRDIGRIRISTTYPFGIFRAWTWLHTDAQMLVYPAPEGTLAMPAGYAPQPGAQVRRGAGVEEWAGLRPFRDGDSPRQVDWKAYAREAPLLVKEYHALGSEQHHFDYGAVRIAGVEARLSQLARWIVDADARGERYALQLPGTRIAADTGTAHRERCLAVLARFQPAAAELA